MVADTVDYGEFKLNDFAASSQLFRTDDGREGRLGVCGVLYRSGAGG